MASACVNVAWVGRVISEVDLLPLEGGPLRDAEGLSVEKASLQATGLSV